MKEIKLENNEINENPVFNSDDEFAKFLFGENSSLSLGENIEISY